MNEKLKTLSSFSSCIETFTFERGKSSVELDIDVDAFTEEYFRNVGKRQRDRLKIKLVQNRKALPIVADVPETAIAIQTPEDDDVKTLESLQQIWESAAKNVADQKTLHIDMLLGGEVAKEGNSLLVNWDIVDDQGKAVTLNAAALRHWSAKGLDALWEFCAEKARPLVKKIEAATVEPESRNGSFSRSQLGS